MEYRKLGGAGLDISAIGLGTEYLGKLMPCPDHGQPICIVAHRGGIRSIGLVHCRVE
jgi:aryl-alcohol dehydrogenase-like predicted oxidoreductase